MSAEAELHVRIPPDLAERAAVLRRQLSTAQFHLDLATPDDRGAAARYELIASQLEGLAYEGLTIGAVLEPSPGPDTVTVVWPFKVGTAENSDVRGAIRQPAAIWRSSNPQASRTAATFERFDGQLEAWANSTADSADRLSPLNPSGIQNKALTCALRRHTMAGSGPLVEVPVVYHDGSPARAYPIRALPLLDQEPSDGRELLKMTLLSVRHFEMDSTVDGAWFRNRDISVKRPRGQTDEIAHNQTLAQLRSLASAEPFTLYLYQTGLEAANFAFYRALVDYHRLGLGYPVCVVPQFFAGGNSFEKGTPWNFQ
ncbi:hypothetical protein E3O45_02630 [Cryobacterium sp. TMS1-20-1]|uniref:hypothetical protein n=1 Tax=Cryobacterium sp. TMS1-20-1 TaxID=1259223 RepID=UPI00106D354C|nr:hypothetical protein [Cryobacterium sp. TMS1-20-1]TFC80056.1 hypothetical protein E3O45_02630 [Cryobacterium sp. TMS1-20-1]